MVQKVNAPGGTFLLPHKDGHAGHQLPASARGRAGAAMGQPWEALVFPPADSGSSPLLHQMSPGGTDSSD